MPSGWEEGRGGGDPPLIYGLSSPPAAAAPWGERGWSRQCVRVCASPILRLLSRPSPRWSRVTETLKLAQVRPASTTCGSLGSVSHRRPPSTPSGKGRHITVLSGRVPAESSPPPTPPLWPEARAAGLRARPSVSRHRCRSAFMAHPSSGLVSVESALLTRSPHISW